MEFDYFYNREAEIYNFIRLPMVLMEDEIFKEVSVEAKVLYALMLNRMGLSYKNGWQDEEGKTYIYYTVNNIKNQFNCSNDKALKLLDELNTGSGIGLIERKRQGLGKPNRIYVKNFMSVFRNPKAESLEFQESEVQSSEKQNSVIPKNGVQGFRKSESNYIKSSNTEINHTELRKIDLRKGKKPYGLFKNVFLSDDDMKTLSRKMGSELDELIDRLSSYMKSNAREYDDHRATIINWHLNDRRQSHKKGNAPSIEDYYQGDSL